MKSFRDYKKWIRVLFVAVLTGMVIILGSSEAEASNGGDWYFDENNLSRIEEAVAATPYGFFVEDAFNETGAAFAMGRMLHYLGYNDWTHVVEADGKQYLDVKITEGTVRVDFYHGKAYFK